MSHHVSSIYSNIRIVYIVYIAYFVYHVYSAYNVDIVRIGINEHIAYNAYIGCIRTASARQEQSQCDASIYNQIHNCMH